MLKWCCVLLVRYAFNLHQEEEGYSRYYIQMIVGVSLDKLKMTTLKRDVIDVQNLFNN
jgi:hypothetical protein